MQSRIVPVLVLGLSLLSGCLDSVIPSHDGNGATGDTTAREEPALFTMLNAHGYKDANSFVQLNQTPYTSSLDGSQIKMYVSKDAAAAYEAVTPDSMTMGAAFPVGGILVREASDANGNLTAITTMVKREAGYFPVVGDFFFGVLDASGNPVTENGELEWGKVQACAGCHQPRASSGYLFGVPTADRH
jgi:hypothetical protein